MTESFETARVPPQDIDAERAVLGAMLLEGEAAGLALGALVATDFYREAHRIIFSALGAMCLAGGIPDELLLRAHLEASDKLEEIGGADYIHELAMSVPSAANIERYAKLVREKSIARMLINASTATLSEARDAGDIHEVVDRGHARMTEVALKASGSSEQGVVRIGDLLQENFTELKRRHEHPNKVWGLATGLRAFDYQTGGLHPGSLCILAAKSGIGKTAMLLTWFDFIISGKNACLLFSLEMRRQEINNRLISMRSGLSFGALMSGNFGEQAWSKIVSVNADLQDAPLFIDDTPAVSLAQIHAKARQAKAQHDIQVIGIDYVQILTAPKAQSRAGEVAALSGGLKKLARELDIPVILLSQFRKGKPGEEGRRPSLEDLKETSALRQDADVVVILHRKTEGDEGYSNETRLDIAKQRNGPTGAKTITFRPERMKFVDEVKEREEQTAL